MYVEYSPFYCKKKKKTAKAAAAMNSSPYQDYKHSLNPPQVYEESYFILSNGNTLYLFLFFSMQSIASKYLKLGNNNNFMYPKQETTRLPPPLYSQPTL